MLYEIPIRLRQELRAVVPVGGAPDERPPAAGVAEPPEPPPPPRPDPAEEQARLLREQSALVESLLVSFDETARGLREQQAQRLGEMQKLAVELAVAIASRLTHIQIRAGDFAVEQVAAEVVRQLEPAQSMTVYLHPDDLELLRERAGGHDLWAEAGDPVRLAADPSLPRGACRGESGDVSVRADVETRLADVRTHLLNLLPDAEIERRRSAAAERNLGRFPDRRETA